MRLQFAEFSSRIAAGKGHSFAVARSNGFLGTPLANRNERVAYSRAEEANLMKTLKTLLLNELADMYDAEHRILKALPKMIKAATCEKLQQALQKHLGETEGHVEKLERVFAAFDEKATAKKCPAMVGILDEGDDLVSENKKESTINAAIVAACQKVEHYEIASYGTIREWTKLVGNDEAAALVEEILRQEKAADHVLTELAAEKNKEALHEMETSVGANA